MKHVKVLLFALACIAVQSVFSQTISKSVIGSAGNTRAGDNIRLSYAVGETVAGNMTSPKAQLSNVRSHFSQNPEPKTQNLCPEC